MKFLLDTVALYRAATAPDTLSGECHEILRDASAQLFVSLISAWELGIKSSLGKLPLPCPVDEFFSQVTQDLLAQPLALDLRFVARMAQLPHHHGDPFDRLIIAQALVEDCAVITSDRQFADYGITVFW